MSMRGVIVAIVLLVLVRDASADTVVIGTPGQIGAALLGANVGGALGAGVELARSKAQFNAQIRGARHRFFAEYPNGKNFAQAEKDFAELLWAKDVYFMSMMLQTGSMPEMSGKLDAVTGGTLDNGIPGGAFPQWVSGIRASLGATSSRVPLASLFDERKLLAALEANKDAYAQYKKGRDEAEFEMQCQARPGPYCALPAGRGYSHGGDTQRAARIADYYLAHHAQRLPGGDEVKRKLRDAIIKYESLAYTTQDCLRYVGRGFENDPRHDRNLAALRRAIAKYESVKVVSPEDTCIRAVQEMQWAEAGAKVGALPRDFWDGTFRTSKFNELYGSLTSDQVRQFVQPGSRAERDHASRVTIIDYYTRSPEARAAKIPQYEIVRPEVIHKALPVQAAARAPADTALPKTRDPGPVPSTSAAAPGVTSVPPYNQALSAYGNRDYARARALFEQACNEGNSWGCSDLGIMFSSGKGGAVDMARAQEAFDKACKGGNATACSKKDAPLPAVAKAPAVSNDPNQKIYDEAVMASRSRDHTRARSLLRKPARVGNAKGCFELGSMFGTGTGGPVDQTQARVFYEQACTGGDARGCLNLGFLFSAGIGGPQDSARAESLYEQACKAGESLRLRAAEFVAKEGQIAGEAITLSVRRYGRICPVHVWPVLRGRPGSNSSGSQASSSLNVVWRVASWVLPRERGKFGESGGLFGQLRRARPAANLVIYWRRARDSNPQGACAPVDFKSTALPVEASPPWQQNRQLRYTSATVSVRCTAESKLRPSCCAAESVAADAAGCVVLPGTSRSTAAARCPDERCEYRATIVRVFQPPSCLRVRRVNTCHRETRGPRVTEPVPRQPGHAGSVLAGRRERGAGGLHRALYSPGRGAVWHCKRWLLRVGWAKPLGA